MRRREHDATRRRRVAAIGIAGMVLASGGTIGGCREEPGDDRPSADAEADAARSRTGLYADAPAYEGPPATFEVEVDGSSTSFAWTVQVPTGGWSLDFDGAVSRPDGSSAAIRVTLVPPPPGTMTTQALETLSGEYRHGAKAFDSAVLLIRRVPPGGVPDDAGWARAASWSAD